MNKKYLPSEKLRARLVLAVAVFLIIFALYEAIPAIVRGVSNARKNAVLKKMLVKDVVEQDSNFNGIADWEETLWGLDPTKNGPENKEFILAKKAVLNPDGSTIGGGDLTGNDKMARELLATIVTLESSGNLTTDAMGNISKAFGDKIAIEPIDDIYTQNMISTIDPDDTSIKKYYNDFKKISAKYQNKDMGNEFTFISQGIKNDDQNALNVAKAIAESYRSFGKDLMGITVPTSLMELHTSIANNYEKTGLSIEKMTSSLTDQISGMNGILSYKKYSDDLFADLENLQTFFEKNGILKSS